MTGLVPIALFGWIPLVLLLFATLQPKIATGLAFAAGWCFLPVAGYALPGLPNYTKMFATNIGCVLGILLFHAHLLTRFKLSMLDLPVVVYCLCPFVSSMTNGLGAYDGVAASVGSLIAWGVPYFVGRLVYKKPRDLLSLCISIIACGLLYVPLCLWEVRMSPQLHQDVYGFSQKSFKQAIRFGGYRPTVFMQHGLQVALWMGSCMVLVFAFWYTAQVRRYKGLPVWILVLAFGLTTLALKSLGGWLLVAASIMLLIIAKKRMNGKVLLAFVVAICVYLGVRSTGVWSGDSLVTFVGNTVNAERAGSLRFRFDNENILAEKAWRRPLFGWGGWGRNRVHDEEGNDISVTDGMWVIVFGVNGLVGLVSFYAMLLWAPTRWLRKVSPKLWKSDPAFAMGSALGVVLTMNALDTLPNAMLVPVFVMAIGAMSSTLQFVQPAATSRIQSARRSP